MCDGLVFLERYEITVAMAPGTASGSAGSAGGAQGNGAKGAQRAQSQNGHDWADLLNVESDSLIQEIGWDEDCDDSISEALEDAIGDALLDIDTDEVVDVVLLWWRDEDGDLVDGLVDATRSLGEDGRIWLLTPAKLDAGLSLIHI